MTEFSFSQLKIEGPGTSAERVLRLKTSSSPSIRPPNVTLSLERDQKSSNAILRQMQRLHIRTPGTTGNSADMAEPSPEDTTRELSSNDMLTPPSTPSTSRSKLEEPSPSRWTFDTTPKLDFELDLTHAEFLGSGAWCNVYKVTSLPLSREPSADALTPPSTPQTKKTFHIPKAYAVKSASRSDSHGVLAHEAKILTRIQRHENSPTYVIPFYGVLPTSSLLFHCAESGTLETLTLHTASSPATEILHTFLSLLPQLTSGLAFLHSASVIHADIKPANILLDHRSRGLTARYADFSASFVSTSAPSAVSGGTWAYMAPEQLYLDPKLSTPTFASDVYALGVTLVAFLCGDNPFASVQGNVFRLREAVKMGDVLGWASNEDAFAQRLAAVHKSWTNAGTEGNVTDCFKSVLTKKREKRSSAEDWKAQADELTGKVKGELGVGLGIGWSG